MIMNKLPLVVSVVIIFAFSLLSAEFRQGRSKITYWNPKYISNVSVFTRRVSRHEPYRTNLTGTTLVPYGNNVTVSVILEMKNGGDFRIDAKLCETTKIKWINHFITQFTNFTLNKCPIPVGIYGFINMELPPKNVPIPVIDGDYKCTMELSITATKEKIMSTTTILYFDSKSNTNKNADRNKNKEKKG